ncbi:hypothetical protein [Spongiivirga citrea]|uniref:Uncharacterized protein n=1 Tax=Spongiivirga citrea TaxID=1481457 RepID=A0A6M0CKP3_9FLAO|nr:hypothetical protein [Spongiivirga citrea]NER16534.1 hypothetical protein [Spongiivirga citrea]
MKKLSLGIMLCALALITTSLIDKDDETLTANFITGNPEIASINTLSFGPEGILFIGDSKNATVYAIDTKDIDEKQEGSKYNMGEFDNKIAASLGTDVDNIKITDMAVNPISKSVYFSVNTADGTPVLLKLKGENFENVSLTKTSFSKIGLNNAVAADKKDRRGRSQRVWAISDLVYHNGKVMVTGLSNKEFSSTFRSIPFPFKDKQDFASLEIYHAAHGKYETHAPIKTFSVINMENTDYVLASYTCTPLVLFPLNDLKNGKHTKGRTVAELGSGNSPIDMISFKKEGKPYFVMTNTNRSAMRIDYETIASFKESLTEPVTEFAVATGVNYVSLPMVNVLQLDNLDKENVVYMQRTASGELVLRSRPTKWM